MTRNKNVLARLLEFHLPMLPPAYLVEEMTFRGVSCYNKRLSL